jgi:hypothetical protein
MRAVVDPDVVRERWLELLAPGAVAAQQAACVERGPIGHTVTWSE